MTLRRERKRARSSSSAHLDHLDHRDHLVILIKIIVIAERVGLEMEERQKENQEWIHHTKREKHI